MPEARASAMPVPGARFLLMGVMSNPSKDGLRDRIRTWNRHFSTAGREVHVRFVYGRQFYNGTGDDDALRHYAREVGEHDDLMFVDGRERLPHVGVVTEKSAAFWQSVAIDYPGYEYYCKADDDTLVHLDRLHANLRQLRASLGGDAAVYFGHLKWRGWDVDERFQACGGSWGGAQKTMEDILHGGVNVDRPYPPCPHAAGPYPYMSGGMVCMSRPLAAVLARDPAFDTFLKVARSRNTLGSRCRKPAECASQPPSAHMWHHEDAGMGFNVFRAVVSANMSAHVVPVPGHFNDPGIIERSDSAQDSYWATRSLFVHGVKSGALFETAQRRWHLDRPSAELSLKCENCSKVDGFHWNWARAPCAPRAWHEPQTGKFCHVDPDAHFRCCAWPWILPRGPRQVLEALREGGGRLSWHELNAAMRQAHKRARASAGGDGGGAPPGGAELHRTLQHLHGTGRVRYSAAAEEGKMAGKGSAIALAKG